MRNVSIGLLGLMGVLSWGSGSGWAQGEEGGTGTVQILLDETGVLVNVAADQPQTAEEAAREWAQQNGTGGVFVDAETGRVLTPEEMAAEAGLPNGGVTEPTPPPEEANAEEPSRAETPPTEAGASWGGSWGAFPQAESASAPPPPASKTPSPARPPSPSPPPSRTRETDDDEERFFRLLDETVNEPRASSSSSRTQPTVAPPRSQPSTPLASPAAPPPPPSSRPLLPPNSPAERLLRDNHYAMNEARLIAGPNGRWLTFQEALGQRYREAEIRALRRRYEAARQFWGQGNQAELRRTLAAFVKGLNQLNATVKGSHKPMPDNGGLDLEALREQLEAEEKARATAPPPQEVPVPAPERQRRPWLLPVAGLGAVVLLGVGLVVWQTRRPRGSPALLVRGRVSVWMGPDAGQVWEVAGERVILGSGEECDVTLTDFSLAPVHTALTHEPEGIHVLNLEPDHETRINGHPVASSLLREGDMIEMGQTTLSFEEVEE